MIVWINGAFGAGKTTVSELLHQKMPKAHIFDPEEVGYIIQKRFPAARSMDYQDLPMWRRLVTQFIVEAKAQFPTPLIIPMTLVVPEYLKEIFVGIETENQALYHFFLETSKVELTRRITQQVIVESDAERDAEVREWRLAQIDRCVAAADLMPEGTVMLKTDNRRPEQLVEHIIHALLGQ
ncbi:MAG: tunicamycin resistance protein [Chloroflexota bacterium]